MAVASAAHDRSVPQRVVAIGEVGLAGELRRVPGIDRRLAEAARLGFTEAVIPAASRDARDQVLTVHAGMRVHAVPTVEQALAAVGLMPPERHRRDIGLNEPRTRSGPLDTVAVGLSGVPVQDRASRAEVQPARDGLSATDRRTDRGARTRRSAPPAARLSGPDGPGNAAARGVRADPAGRTGALVVLGQNKVINQISTGGFALDVAYTPTALRELAKMDGAIVLDWQPNGPVVPGSSAPGCS